MRTFFAGSALIALTCSVVVAHDRSGAIDVQDVQRICASLVGQAYQQVALLDRLKPYLSKKNLPMSWFVAI